LDGSVWRRTNSRVGDTDGFTDQLALTGKFDTGAFKHRFNTGVEYAKQTDRTQYILNGLDSTGSANNTCNAAAIASGWCTYRIQVMFRGQVYKY
jgi:catecholate siderophore receptor